jgi:hypothetical protein
MPIVMMMFRCNFYPPSQNTTGLPVGIHTGDNGDIFHVSIKVWVEMSGQFYKIDCSTGVETAAADDRRHSALPAIEKSRTA